MSQQQVVQDHEEHRKEIVMCAYAARDSNYSIQEWAERVSGIDCTSKELKTDEEYEVEISWDSNGVRTDTCSIFKPHIEKGELADKVKREIKNCDQLTLNHKVEESYEYINSLSSVKYKLMRELFDELPDVISDGYHTHSERPRLGVYEVEKTEDGEESLGDKVVNVNIDGFEERRILKKENEREPGSMYESFGKVPSYQFTLKLEAPSEELMNEWTDEVIIKLHKILNKRNGVRSVRYTSCEVTTTKEGECFI